MGAGRVGHVSCCWRMVDGLWMGGEETSGWARWALCFVFFLIVVGVLLFAQRRKVRWPFDRTALHAGSTTRSTTEREVGRERGRCCATEHATDRCMLHRDRRREGRKGRKEGCLR